MKHLYTMTHNVDGVPTKLLNWKANRIVNVIEYIKFLEANGEEVLVNNPTKWV